MGRLSFVGCRDLNLRSVHHKTEYTVFIVLSLPLEDFKELRFSY